MNHINVSALKQRIDNGDDLIIIDVREANEYAEDNIGAILVPLSDIRNFETEAIDELKDKEIIVHCRSGQRSMQAIMLLSEAGFTNLVNLEGGIMDWRATLGATNLK